MAVRRDKKTGKWFYRIYYTDLKGNRRETKKAGFKTKKDATDAELYFYSKLDLFQNQTCSNMTFQALYDIYIKSKRQELKPKSFMTIESIFINHILPYFKDFKIEKITNRDYLEWKDYILDKGFSHKYNTSIHICMVNILNYAKKFYGLEKNIASEVGNFTNKKYIAKVDFWTIEEFKKFINSIDEEDIEYKTLFVFLFNTGVRIGEALALNWYDIDNDVLNIDKTLTRSKEDNYIINSPKTASSIRKLKLDKITIEYLQKLKKQYMSIAGFTERWFIFGGIKPLARTTIATKKNYYCRLSDVKQIRMHDFRHSHASLLISKGIPLTAVSKRLGHKDVSTTLNIYSHMIPEDEEKAIAVIEKNYEK